MHLQYPPATLDRIVFAVVWWVIDQLDFQVGLVSELNEPVNELRSSTSNRRTIVQEYLQFRNPVMCCLVILA